MAVDEAVLLSVASGDSPPTIRFYTWRPACLSLGYFQRFAEVDAAACAKCGFDLVRRPTGGSAILHADEFTYSIAAPQADAHVTGDIPTSYRKIASVLVRSLQEIGVCVDLAPLDRGKETGRSQTAHFEPETGRPVLCFARPAHSEILAQGRKLVGSAQVRRGGALLQHGAIPLGGNVAAVAALLKGSDEERKSAAAILQQQAITLKEAAGRHVAFTELTMAMEKSFVQEWRLDLKPGELTTAETDLVAKLCRDKYENPAWTQSR